MTWLLERVGEPRRQRATKGPPVRVSVRVHPAAKQPLVGGAVAGVLVVRVRARAIDGAANAEALVAIACALGVRRSAVHLVHGVRSRNKVVDVAGDEVDLAQRLRRLRDGAVATQ